MKSRGLFLLAMVGALTPGVARACAVCFGQTDSPLGKGLHWGVFALLGFVVVMLSGIGGFAVFLARRAAALERQDARAAGELQDAPPSVETR